MESGLEDRNNWVVDIHVRPHLLWRLNGVRPRRPEQYVQDKQAAVKP